ncbi:hypothetical protein ACVIW2_007092 [Bradyrhizobium huanghuaihaiense]
MFERSKVPLSAWLQIIHLENTKRFVPMTPWEMAQASGLEYKTVQKMRARIYAAVDTYDGPNTIFGRAITAYISTRRPKPPKLAKRRDGKVNLRRWYEWRGKHPLGEAIAAEGTLAGLDDMQVQNIESTEKLVRLLLRTPKPAPAPTVRKGGEARASRKRIASAANTSPFSKGWRC